MRNASKVTVGEVFEVPAYRTVRTEEGSYEVRDGFNVIAYSEVRDDIRVCFLYVGDFDRSDANDYAPAYNFANESKAAAFVGRVKDSGRIDTTYWYAYKEENIMALPDYVLNPHRPEYN